MRSALVLVALLSASAPASAFTLEQVMSAPFCSDLVAAARAPRIAWAVNLRGERNVWAAEAPAWRPHAVTHYRGDTGQPLGALAISPDGKLVVFVRGGDGEHTPNPASLVQPPKRQVIAAAIDGSGEPRVLGDGGDELQLSPDGTRVAWAVKGQLWVAAVDGSAPAHAVAELRGSLGQLRWAPDGKRVAASVDRKTHALIAVVQLDGEAVRWIAPSTAHDLVPLWSPDGRRLAFVRTAGFERRQPLIPDPPQPWSLVAGRRADRRGPRGVDQRRHGARLAARRARARPVRVRRRSPGVPVGAGRPHAPVLGGRGRPGGSPTRPTRSRPRSWRSGRRRSPTSRAGARRCCSSTATTIATCRSTRPPIWSSGSGARTRVEEIVDPDEIHDLLLWRSWIDAYRATAAFFGREL